MQATAPQPAKDPRMNISFLLSAPRRPSSVSCTSTETPTTTRSFKPSYLLSSDQDEHLHNNIKINNLSSSMFKRKRVKGRRKDILEQAFALNPRPSTEDKAAMAEMLNMTLQHIHGWFQNKRATVKRRTKREMIRLYGKQPTQTTSTDTTPNNPNFLFHFLRQQQESRSSREAQQQQPQHNFILVQ